MKKMELILRKCRDLSRQLGRTSSYGSLRSKFSDSSGGGGEEDEEGETVFVGSSRRRYIISSKHLNHPLLNALIQKSKQKPAGGGGDVIVRCEVVLFDHLLWMLENADPKLVSSDSLEELAELYVY